jgi:hypothetical protein
MAELATPGSMVTRRISLAASFSVAYFYRDMFYCGRQRARLGYEACETGLYQKSSTTICPYDVCRDRSHQM